MDGSWERVSYSKKQKEKLSKSEKRRQKENMPTINSLDPTVRSSVYKFADSSNSDDEEDFAPRRENGAASKAAAAAAGDRKSTAAAAKQKAQLSNRDILHSLPVSKLQQTHQQSKATIPDSPLAWLIDICAVIDLQLSFDKREEWVLADLDYPLNQLNSSCRNYLAELVKSVTDEVKVKFILHAMQRVASQWERRQCAAGTRAAAQLVAKLTPQLLGGASAANASKLVEVVQRASPAVVLPTVWPIAQLAYRDPASALPTVLHAVLPLLQVKSLSQSVMELVEFTVSKVSSSSSSSQCQLRTADAVKLLTMPDLASLNPNIRDRLRGLNKKLLAAMLQAAGSDAEAVRVLYPAAAEAAGKSAAGCGAELLQLLLHSLKFNSQQRLQQVSKLMAGRAWLQLNDAIVKFVLIDSCKQFSRQQRQQFAVAMQPMVNKMHAVCAQAVQQQLQEASRSTAAVAAGAAAGACYRLLLYAIIAALLLATGLVVLASVPQASLPKFVQPVHETLERQQILYKVRALHSTTRAYYNKELQPIIRQQLEQLSQFYHSSLAPKLQQLAATVQHYLQRAQLAERLSTVAGFVRSQAVRCWTTVESELHAYAPDLLEAIAAAAVAAGSAAAGAVSQAANFVCQLTHAVTANF